jgi:hypothetical protein
MLFFSVFSLRETLAMPFFPTFTKIPATMQLLKLTVISCLFSSLFILGTSCEKDSEKQKGERLYKKTEIPMTGAQAVALTSPGVGTSSPALGLLSVTYSKDARLLTYSFTWSALTDTITSMSLLGPAPVGYPSGTIKQALPGFGSDLKANQKTYPFQGGSYSGTLTVDDLVVKEQDILNQMYYIVIRTKAFPGTLNGALTGPSNGGGEIRAQVKFQ